MNLFIVVASSFNENSGGTIALHKLCDLLNKNGNKAYLWPLNKALLTWRYPIKSLIEIIKYFYRLLKYPNYYKYKTFSSFNTPIAKKRHLKNAIVVYPEIISGNPLFSKKVVRWFLNKPGVLSGEINYGKNELYFYYQEAFNDQNINKNLDNRLQVSHIRDDIYN
ncbi:MAG: hypothetical protein KC414_12765 [Romboutsia sp.]|nr:hypothetical protein [Romboutsia sp.]